MSRTQYSLLLLAFLCGSGSAARADAGDVPERFGRVGQRAVFGALGAWATLGNQGSQVERDIELSASPGLWLFVSDDVALGAAVNGYYGDHGLTSLPYSDAELGANIGCGLNVPLQSALSLFPRVWLGFGWVTQTRQVLRSLSSSSFADSTFTPAPSRHTQHGFYGSAELQVPLHIQLATTTYFEVGPFGYFRLAGGDYDNRLRFGLSLVIGRVF